MKKSLIILMILNAFIILLNSGCKKDFLDAKPSTSIIQPATLDDFQGLLDNMQANNISSALGILAADEYTYKSYVTWQSVPTATERNSYLWAKDLFAGEVDRGDWNTPFQSIFYANNVLAGLAKLKPDVTTQARWNNIRGWALFNRAFAYFDLARNFSPAYDESTASADPGMPLRTDPSIDQIASRSSVQQTYDLILSDLASATMLLDAGLPASNRNRPSKISAHALFARIYLSMRKYELAEKHADSTLMLYNKLIDYNTVSQTSTTPFTTTNDESLYAESTPNTYAATQSGANAYVSVSTDNIGLYTANDLRLAIYFTRQADGSYNLKRNYYGTGLYAYTGLATDEVYLIKAECAARRNDISTTMTCLNALLVKRYVTNKFIPLTATTGAEALVKVLLERRKELIWRGLRWDDLKRLNKEGANITLTRTLNGQVYTLAPNSARYVFPIPDNEILLGGITQNQR